MFCYLVDVSRRIETSHTNLLWAHCWAGTVESGCQSACPHGQASLQITARSVPSTAPTSETRRWWDEQSDHWPWSAGQWMAEAMGNVCISESSLTSEIFLGNHNTIGREFVFLSSLPETRLGREDLTDRYSLLNLHFSGHSFCTSGGRRNKEKTHPASFPSIDQ